MTEKKEPRPEPGLENQLCGQVSTLDCSTIEGDWASYIEGFADWSSFWTLTFRDRDNSHQVQRTEAEFLFTRLIQILNTDLFGNHYTQKVGHCYFSYCVGYEHGKQGHLHIHVLADRRVNFALLHRVWRSMAGGTTIKVVHDKIGAARYLAKYVGKGGDVNVYRPKRVKSPAFEPSWFKSD